MSSDPDLFRGKADNDDKKAGYVLESSQMLRAAVAEIQRLEGALEAVTMFYQVTHCHAAAQAGLAGLPVGDPQREHPE